MLSSFHLQCFRPKPNCKALLLLLVAFFIFSACAMASGNTSCVLIEGPTAGLAADDATDPLAVSHYQEAVAYLLDQDEFHELDCLADAARSSKLKFSGGVWKLHTLYAGLSEPLLHPTQDDWNVRFHKLKQWQLLNPESITARVALAKTFISFGFDARGSGFADTVSDSGWKLFGERIRNARSILEAAASLQTKCPEWYFAMQQVALYQSWTEEKTRALFEKAFSIDPDYYYFARMEATYLLPKWHGEQGAAERFTKSVADRLGGERGDVLYFQLAANLVCGCNNGIQLNRLSWPRIQKGFAALDKKYGTSLLNLNLLAYMASQMQDSVVADTSFTRIGNNWAQDVWKKQRSYEAWKKWASDSAPWMAWKRAADQEAETNVATKEGALYKAALEKLISNDVKQCTQNQTDTPDKVVGLIRISRFGTAMQWNSDAKGEFSRCLIQKVITEQSGNPPSYPVPPKPEYWMKIEVDVTSLTSVASN